MLSLKEHTMLGNVPEDWQVIALKNLISEHYPGDWGTEYGVDTIRVLRSTNLTNDGKLNLSDIANRSLKQDKAKRLTPKKGDILLERSGGGPGQPVGRVGFIDCDMPGYAFSNFLHLLRPDTCRINSRFLGWVLYRINATGRILRLEQQTTGLRNLYFRDYLTMPVPVPSSEEQKAIARILDAVDTAIERTREAIEYAKVLKESLIQNFLFEALGETAYADRPTKKISAGWKLIPTDDLLQTDPKNGASPKSNSQPPGIPTFSIAAIRNGFIDLENIEHRKYAQLSEKIAEKYLLAYRDVLIVRGNANPDLVGKAGIIKKYPDGCIYPDITKRVIFKTTGDYTVSPEYATIIWNHSVVHNQILRRAKTSNGTLKINNRDVKQIIMPVAPKAEQEQIVGVVDAVENKIASLNEMLTFQQILKKSLMHDLLTGKVRTTNLSPETFPRKTS